MKCLAINASVAAILGLGIGLALVCVLGGGRAPAVAALHTEGHIEAPGAPSAEGSTELADVLHVCFGGCLYSSIQDAVDAATDGDVIKVATGIYTDVHARPRNDVTTTGTVTQVVYISKTVVIHGGYTTTNWMVSDPETYPTVLDAGGQGRVLYITGDTSPTIEGLRITGGDWDPGGGVYVVTATVTLSGCQIISNTAITGSPPTGAGGGIYLRNSPNATMTGNGIQGNESWIGGGVYLSASGNARLVGNTIRGNTAAGWYGASGGGVLLWESTNATLTGNTIQGNLTQVGGGVFAIGSDGVTLSGNTIQGNSGEQAGGICLRDSDNATLSGNAISGNRGSGVDMRTSDNVLLDNNVIADNQGWWTGGGIYVTGSTVTLRHTTLARNGGSGVYVTDNWSGETRSTVALTNTVLVSHTVGITVTGGSTATLNGVLWYENKMNTGGPGTLTVTHQITGSPAFAADGYHITSASAALDAGVYAGVTTDVDGDPRPLGSGYDLGADEVSLLVTKQATPDPVQPGAPLTYTIHITNLLDVVLHATITDTLPLSVTLDEASGGTLALPGGTVALPDGRVVVSWTDVVTAPGGLWMGTILVTVDESYEGPLTNLVEVTTEEGAAGEGSVTVVASRRIYLPLVMRDLDSHTRL
jgi:parallel beta-helix repeat protein